MTQTVAHLVSGCELAWFLMCTLLVTQVTCLASGCELAWLFMHALLVTQILPCLVSEGELA